jgi:hypothetical protein
MLGHKETYPCVAPSILPLLKARMEGFRCWAVTFDLMPSMVAKHVPLRPIFGARNNQKSLGGRSGEYGCWVMTQEAMCGLVRYRDAGATVPPCLPLVTSLPLQNLHVEMANNTCPGGTNSWCTQLSMSKRSGHFLTAPRIASCTQNTTHNIVRPRSR